MDPVGLSLYVETIFVLHENKSFSQVLTSSGIFSRCMVHESNLSLDSLLKLAICYLPHANQEDLIKKLLMELTNHEPSNVAFKQKIELVSRVQEVLLECSQEFPIFHYQFSTFASLRSSSKEHLGNEIQKILLHHCPEKPIVYKYFTSVLSTLAPPISVFSILPTRESLKFYSKALWRYSNSYSADQVNEIISNCMQAIPLDQESLYYFTSISKIRPKELVVPSGFYLAICYNFQETPEVSNEILQNLDIKALFGEPLIKTLLMLDKKNLLGDFVELTGNLNYSSSSDPEIKNEIFSEFISMFTKTIVPNLNYYAISTFFSKNIKKISKEELSMIFSSLKTKWDQINPKFQKELGRLSESSNIDEMLVLNQSLEARMRIIELQKTCEITSKNLVILEAMVKHKILLPNVIIKYLNLSHKIKQESELVKIISLVLELLSFTGNHNAFLEIIFTQLEKFRLWPALSQDDLINFFFIKYGSNLNSLKVPQKIEDSFLASLTNLNSYEDLNASLQNNLKYYKSFKYTTELEPRLIVSNSMEYKTAAPEITISPEMPIEQLVKYLKLHSIFIKCKMESSDDCKSAIKKYYNHREKDITIRNIKRSIFSVLNDIQGKAFSMGHIDNFTHNETEWRGEIYFPMAKTMVKVFTEQDMYYGEDGMKGETCLIHQTMIQQLEKAMNAKVIKVYDYKWNAMNVDDQQTLLSPLLKGRY